MFDLDDCTLEELHNFFMEVFSEYEKNEYL